MAETATGTQYKFITIVVTLHKALRTEGGARPATILGRLTRVGEDAAEAVVAAERGIAGDSVLAEVEDVAAARLAIEDVVSLEEEETATRFFPLVEEE